MSVSSQIASELVEKLQDLRDGLDTWDNVCPACNGVTAHNGHCVSFEIDNLLIRARSEMEIQAIIHLQKPCNLASALVAFCGADEEYTLTTLDREQVTCKDCLDKESLE